MLSHNTSLQASSLNSRSEPKQQQNSKFSETQGLPFLAKIRNPRATTLGYNSPLGTSLKPLLAHIASSIRHNLKHKKYLKGIKDAF